MLPKFGGSYYILLSFLAKLALDYVGYTPRNLNIAPEKLMVGRLVSFWEGILSGAMLNFRGVRLFVTGCFFWEVGSCRNTGREWIFRLCWYVSYGWSTYLPKYHPLEIRHY